MRRTLLRRLTGTGALTKWTSGALAFALIGWPSAARADKDQVATESTESDKPFTTKIVADVRLAALVRASDGYFSQAHTFGYPVSSVAPGIEFTFGVELFPRFTLGASGAYFGSGATRRFARLMLTSEEVELTARYAALRYQSDFFLVQLEGVLGGGRYWIRETYSDPSLFSNTFAASDASMGFHLGADASLHVSGFRFVVGYAYHYAKANIENEIGGVARAGGHIIDIGFGARF